MGFGAHATCAHGSDYSPDLRKMELKVCGPFLLYVQYSATTCYRNVNVHQPTFRRSRTDNVKSSRCMVSVLSRPQDFGEKVDLAEGEEEDTVQCKHLRQCWDLGKNLWFGGGKFSPCQAC